MPKSRSFPVTPRKATQATTAIISWLLLSGTIAGGTPVHAGGLSSGRGVLLGAPNFSALAIRVDQRSDGLDADGSYNLGVRAYNAGDFDASATYFLSAIKFRPRFADAYYNLGLCYEAKKDYKSAIQSFSEAIAGKPTFADAYVERGVNYADSGDFPAAMADFSRALAVKPKFYEAYIARGDAYFQNKQYDLAVAQYKLYQSVDPKPEPVIDYKLGLVAFAETRYDVAFDCFVRFLPNADLAGVSDTYSYLGYCYIAKSDYTNAIDAFTKFLAHHPSDANGLRGRARAYFRAGQNQKAVADYNSYLNLKPDDTDARHDRDVAANNP